MKQQPALSTYGERIAWLRNRFGLSLEQFGLRINVTRSYLSKLERGIAVNPSLEFTDSVAVVYGVHLPWLEDGVGQPFHSQARNEAPESVRLEPPPPPTKEEQLQLESGNLRRLNVLLAPRMATSELVNVLVGMILEPPCDADLTLKVVRPIAEEIRRRILAGEKPKVARGSQDTP